MNLNYFVPSSISVICNHRCSYQRAIIINRFIFFYLLEQIFLLRKADAAVYLQTELHFNFFHSERKALLIAEPWVFEIENITEKIFVGTQHHHLFVPCQFLQQTIEHLFSEMKIGHQFWKRELCAFPDFYLECSLFFFNCHSHQDNEVIIISFVGHNWSPMTNKHPP